MSNPTSGRRDFAVADFASGDAVSSYRVRDQLIGNAMHCADQRCYQHAINWMSCASGFGATQSTWTAPVPTTGVWSLVRSVKGLHMPVHDDGVIGGVNVGIYAASAGGGANVMFAVMIGNANDAIDVTQGNTVIFTSTSSTTPAWLSASSGSVNIVPQINQLLPSIKTRSVLRADGTSSAIQMLEPSINIFQLTTNKAFAGVIYGFHAHAFRGTP